MEKQLGIASIIIPARDAINTIRKTLQSVLSQTYLQLEIIVVDDGSVDGTRALLDSIKDPRIRIESGEGLGVSHARNVGLKVASGEYVMFVDADDELVDGAISSAVQLAREYQCDMVIGGLRKKWDNGHIQSFSIQSDHTVVFEGEDIKALIEMTIGYRSARDSRLNTCHLSGSCCRLMRRDLLEKQRFNEALAIGEDTVFNISVLKECERVAVTPACWYIYNQSVGSKVYRYDEHAFEESAAMLEALSLNVERDFEGSIQLRTLFQLEGSSKRRVAQGCPELSVRDKALALRTGFESKYWQKAIQEISLPSSISCKHKIFLFLVRHKLYRLISFLLEVAQ